MPCHFNKNIQYILYKNFFNLSINSSKKRGKNTVFYLFFTKLSISISYFLLFFTIFYYFLLFFPVFFLFFYYLTSYSSSFNSCNMLFISVSKTVLFANLINHSSVSLIYLGCHLNIISIDGVLIIGFIKPSNKSSINPTGLNISLILFFYLV